MRCLRGQGSYSSVPRRKTTTTKILTYFSNSNGSPIIIYDCTGEDDQRWSFNNHGAITAYSGKKCLDVTDGVNSNGVKIQLWDCLEEKNVNQRWDYGPLVAQFANHLSWSSHWRCLDLTDGDTTNGNRVQLWDTIVWVSAFNFCLITDSCNPVAAPINARLCSLLLCRERLTPGGLLVWHIAPMES